MSDNLQYFQTEAQTEGYIIEYAPFVGYAVDTEQAFFTVRPFSGIFNSKIVPLHILSYQATSAVTPQNVSPTVLNNIYHSETESGTLLFTEVPTTLGTDAFYNNQDLSGITIPASISDISWSAFQYCTNLVSINVDPDNPVYDSRDNCNGIIRTADNTLVNACKATTFPDSVTAIGDYAFRDCRTLTSISIPESITSIGNFAFTDCRSLTDIDIPEHCELGSSVFRDCQSLLTVQLPTNIETIKSELFLRCSELNNITIPSSVKVIENEAFRECSSLSSIVLPEGLTQVDSRAFYKCHALQEITLPSTLTTVGGSAFNDMASTLRVYYNCTHLCDFNNGSPFSNIKEIIFGTNVEYLPINVFASSKITSLQLPSSVTSIGAQAFINCVNLTSISFPETLQTLGGWSFMNCSSLSKVILPYDLQSLGTGAFKRCQALSHVALPVSFNLQTSAVFEGANINTFTLRARTVEEFCNVSDVHCNYRLDVCKYTTQPRVIEIGGQEITHLVIPDSVFRIPHYLFYKCTNLQSVSFPSTLTTISDRSFRYTSLTDVSIPANVTFIAPDAFSYCPYINTISVDENNTVYDSRNNCNAIIDTEKNWLQNGCQSTIIPDDVVKVYGFVGCTSLRSIIIPDSVLELGNSAFLDCTNLTSIQLSNQLTTIEAGALKNTALSSISIPSTVTKIETEAISGCSSLRDIVCLSSTPPALGSGNVLTTVQKIHVPADAVLAYRAAENWSAYGDKIVTDFIPEVCHSLEILSAENVNYDSTQTLVQWTAVMSGTLYGEHLDNVTVTGIGLSDPFEQNSLHEDIQKTITFTQLGVSAEIQITQGAKPEAEYTVNLNNSWRLSTAISNPDSQQYDGVYESNSNFNINSATATMYIDLLGYENFVVYIRSNAESSYDYVMISQPNVSITGSTSYSNSSYVKAHTIASQNAGTAISSYKKVEYTGLNPDTSYRLTVVYRKDTSQHSGTDRGYVLIPKNQ